ncbi:hypothetical protein Sru01_50440 [Sphaerisporangium rufum]|uniref:Uncharacterized protein n=1 Tax=Sphaerisporangium rufum TaxID=1381558 RepID=A0A919RA16_9ACTN|nr:hypothetical protein Sru01_50440 [Sphaerisporangium rufum]
MEDILRRTLEQASIRAPRAPSELSGQVVARSRRRTARIQAAVAALAVVLVAGGVGVAVRGRDAAGTDRPARDPAPASVAPTGAGDRGPTGITDAEEPPVNEVTPPPVSPTATITHSAEPPVNEVTPPPAPGDRNAAGITDAADPPVDQVWPGAVRRLPARLPGVGRVIVKGAIDYQTLLLESWEKFEKAGALYAYDMAGGGVRRIADIHTPKGVYSGGYQVGGGRIVWMTYNGSWTKLWSVSAGGGRPARPDSYRPSASPGGGHARPGR